MKKIAIIDCGTNTFHLLIASYGDENIDILHHEKVVVKIGKGGINNKLISDDAGERALSTIKKFRAKIDREQVDEIRATATSAFRNANNGWSLRNRIHDETNIDIEIISGDNEAELIYRGVTSGIQLKNKTILVMDIGGGSVEFIIGSGNTILWKSSYEIGAQRLLDLFHDSEPISADSLHDLEKYLSQQLEELIKSMEEFKPTILVGSSGTFDTLSAIYCSRHQIAYKEENSKLPFDINSFKGIYDELISKSREERLAIPGMVEMRVDMIVVATTILDFVLKSNSFESIKVSTRALKEGVLYKALDNPL